jgi:hypothetical protein
MAEGQEKENYGRGRREGEKENYPKGGTPWQRAKRRLAILWLEMVADKDVTQQTSQEEKKKRR